MRNLKDERTKIFPSTTRACKELPSRSALDYPSVLSKLATPKPASAINSGMSHVIDGATSAMHDTYDETTSMPDTTVPLSDVLDSPSVMSKLVTPTPASAIRSDMSHVIDDATSVVHDTYDETTSMLDTIVPLGGFLDEQLARAREIENIESDEIEEHTSELQSPQ